jgi:hypothetical protein
MAAKVVSGARQRRTIRSEATALSDGGAGGAMSGRPVSFADSISNGHTVVGQHVRNRQRSPSTGAVSSVAPAGIVKLSVSSGWPVNWTIAIDGTGAR